MNRAWNDVLQMSSETKIKRQRTNCARRMLQRYGEEEGVYHREKESDEVKRNLERRGEIERDRGTETEKKEDKKFN